MTTETITMLDFLPELLGVLIGTIIGYFLASRASSIASKKNIIHAKTALLDEIKHNQNAVKELMKKNAFSNKDHISRPFSKSAYQTAIASGNFAKLEPDIQHILGELYHEIDAFEVYATTIINWLYATIALKPEKQEDYNAFMNKISESEHYMHFTNKINKLLDEARNQIST